MGLSRKIHEPEQKTLEAALNQVETKHQKTKKKQF